jgi:arylsulfatase A-like enzyme
MMKKLLACFLLGCFALNAIAQKTAKPNVIIILMDDMGYGDTEPYGMTGIPTPNFNKLARQGTRFTHFNAGQPICTASRSALLTGCYPTRVGMSGALLPGSKIALNPQETTLAAMLKQAGYQTAMLGKWHLGNKAPYFPIHYGFDSFFGTPYSHDIWPRDHFGARITDPKDIRYNWPELPLLDGDRVVDTIKTHAGMEQLTTMYTTKAVSYINTHKSKPFFLYLAHNMPHVPLAVSSKFKGKSEMGLFGDVIMELDWSIGQVMKALDDNHLADNTILIVASDNGPWLNFGDNAGSSGGFREGKATTFEGGTRVPLLIRWPGKVEAGGINSSLMTNMDLLPTIAAATGAALPKNRIDGLNFLPSLKTNSGKGPREVFYYYFGTDNLEAVRYKNWKLVLPHTSSTYAPLHGIEGLGGKIGRVEIPMALYDLAHDPGEAYDVQALYPEMVKKINTIADAARDDLGDGLTKHTGKNIRPAAVVK